MGTKPIIPSVLLAEDSEDEAFLMRRAWIKAKIVHSLHVVPNGKEAIDFLSSSGKYAETEAESLPSLFILDLKMPLMNGFDVLKWMKARPEFSQLPVVVMSASSAETDIVQSYELGAFCYITKPGHFTELVQTLVRMREFWLDQSSPSSG